MAVPIIDISRNEVERWISAGTLDLVAGNHHYYHVSAHEGYYLVALTAVFATRWDAIWVPSVIETSMSVEKAEDWSRALDEEILSELCGNMFCHCYEIWHLVEVYDENPFGLDYDCSLASAYNNTEGLGFDEDQDDDYTHEQLEYYDALRTLWMTEPGQVSYEQALDFVIAYEYKHSCSFDFESDLEDLRFAGVADRVASSI